MSFMRQHQQRVYAEQTKKQNVHANNALRTAEYRQWLRKLKRDKGEVKSLTDHADRNVKGAEVINGYLDYLNSWLEAGEVHQNDVLTQCVVWATDGERWDVLFDLADPAIENPKVGVLHWMKRDLVDFVADGIMKVADAESKMDIEVKAPVWQVLERIQNESWQPNHVIKARYHRFCGILAEQQQDWTKAADLYAIADELYPNIGVKNKLKNAIKQRDNDSTRELHPTEEKHKASA